ncbi:ATP-grasp domain-containing protein [Bosea sp. 117]|uniref:ATP-grasp domain-containing protein n=1 Tax=Bosea sp. 117 TaxID=1125973 RepID=UPI000493DDF1|nr:ATP-grasp domain-containing protein [Bosea sp. 117]
MLVFVCETVTGGGFTGEPLPESLIAEGSLMRDALISDLEDLPGVRVVTTHDARLPPPERAESTPIPAGGDPRPEWRRLAALAHCCWPVAPERGGELAALAALMREANPRVIGPDAATIAICASKARTAAILAKAGIAVVPTWRAGEVPAGATGPFVLKPDDGAGSEGIHVVDALPASLEDGTIVQPLIEGTAASLTLLCQSGKAHVLTANLQHIRRSNGGLRLAGLTVGGLCPDPELQTLAVEVMQALPGLHGLVGIDYIATPKGPVVVEINPRLTTSYAGLHRSLGVNPVAFVAELIRDGVVPELPHLPVPVPVEIRL